MINILELSEEKRKRLMEEIIKLRLRQREKMGWQAVNNQIQLKVHNQIALKIQKLREHIRQTIDKQIDEFYRSKPEIQSLRQFIPYSDEKKIAEANRYLQKNLFCE